MKFRLVDKILAVDAHHSIEGLKAVSLEEYLLLTRLGVRDRFPATLMAEALFQLGNFLIYASYRNKLALLNMFHRIEIHRHLSPGDTMRMIMTWESVIGDSVKFSGWGKVEGRTVIHGSGCIGSLVDLSQLVDPDTFERQFAALCS